MKKINKILKKSIFAGVKRGPLAFRTNTLLRHAGRLQHRLRFPLTILDPARMTLVGIVVLAVGLGLFLWHSATPVKAVPWPGNMSDWGKRI